MKVIALHGITTCTVILAVALMAGCGSQSKTQQSIQSLQAELKSVKESLRSLEIVLSRAVPEVAIQRLAALENRLEDQNQWPKSVSDAEALAKELDGIVELLPPLASSKVLLQVARIDWGIQSLVAIRRFQNVELGELETALTTMDGILELHPVGSFEEIEKTLSQRIDRFTDQYRDAECSKIINDSQNALVDNNKTADELAALYTRLLEYEDKIDDKKILLQLRQSVIKRNADERITALNERLNNSATLSDERIRQISLASIQEEMLRWIVELEIEKATPKEVIVAAKELEAKVAELRDSSAKQLGRNYQAWALQQILKFDGPDGWLYEKARTRIDATLRSFKDAETDKEWDALIEFPSIRELLAQRLKISLPPLSSGKLPAKTQREIYVAASGNIGWNESIDQEIAYRTTRDGMVKYLLPIQTQLLDPPVAQLYHAAFAKGWQKLEGRDDQLYVAKQTVVVNKQGLDDVPKISAVNQ